MDLATGEKPSDDSLLPQSIDMHILHYYAMNYADIDGET